jgi:glutaredoxin
MKDQHKGELQLKRTPQVHHSAMTGRLAMIGRILLATAFFMVLGLFGMGKYAVFVHRPSSSSTRVVIYTTKRCSYCEKLRRGLTVSGIPYLEHDVERTLQGQLGLWALRARGIPVSVIGPKVVYGYKVEEIEKAMEELGYQYRPGR